MFLLPLKIEIMKITILSSSFGGGGISSYAHELIKCLSQKHHISIVLGDDTVCPVDTDLASVYYSDNDNLSVENAKSIINLINIKIKPDIVINSRSTIFPLIVPYFDNSIKIISVSHSLKYVEADIAGYNSKYVDTIIALSGYGKTYLVNRFGKSLSGKVKVIPNSVETIPNSDTICKNKMESDIISIVFPGGTNSPKAPEIVSAVVSELLETQLKFKFYWLGNTTCPLGCLSVIKDIKELFSKNDDRLEITGLISRDSATKLITEANILLLPSRREGSSISLLESIRCGTIPIVADYLNSNREVIDEYNCGFVIDHNDINGFVDRISDIVINHEQYANLHLKLKNDFEQYFSFKQWSERMNAVMESMDMKHKKRKEIFMPSQYRCDRFVQKYLHKFDYYLSLVQESLPTCISLSLQYMKRKKNKKTNNKKT